MANAGLGLRGSGLFRCPTTAPNHQAIVRGRDIVGSRRKKVRIRPHHGRQRPPQNRVRISVLHQFRVRRFKHRGYGCRIRLCSHTNSYGRLHDWLALYLNHMRRRTNGFRTSVTQSSATTSAAPRPPPKPPRQPRTATPLAETHRSSQAGTNRQIQESTNAIGPQAHSSPAWRKPRKGQRLSGRPQHADYREISTTTPTAPDMTCRNPARPT